MEDKLIIITVTQVNKEKYIHCLNYIITDNVIKNGSVNHMIC